MKMNADLYTNVLPEKKEESIMKLEGTLGLFPENSILDI